MEGLEINITQFINLFSVEDETFRFDSEHYQNIYRETIKKIQKKQYKKLSELIKTPVITGHTPSMKIDRFYGGNIKFIKTDNLRENRISEEFEHTLTEEGNREIARSTLMEGDIITTIIGATFEIVGRTSIIQKEILPANINQNIALIRPEKELVNADYLNIYLNTKYGRNLLYWQSRQTGQVNLNCREVERIFVPIFSTLENYIAKIVHKIENLKIELKSKYEQAENLLFDTLKLKDFEPSQESVNIKTFSESFGNSGRLDPEYYQKKYEELESALIHTGNADKLATVAHFIKRGNQPEYLENRENGLVVLNSKHIRENRLSFDGTRIGNPAKCNLHIEKNDVLMNGTGVGTIGRTAPYLYQEKSIPDNHVTVIRTKGISPIYLSVFLNSIAGQLQVEKHFKGSSGQIELYPEDIENFLIWIAPKAIQDEIEALILSAFALEKQSEQLLETAKRAVEIAIEESEEVAMEYITTMIKKIEGLHDYAFHQAVRAHQKNQG